MNALSHQRTMGGGPGGYGITNLSQQPFNAPGYDPTTVGEVFAEMPLSGSASARGNIASVGQMVQQAALYSSPHFGENIKRDLTEGFNYQLLTQPSVSPNNPAAVARSYNNTVTQNPQYQQLGMGVSMSADKLKEHRRGDENFLQTAVRIASSVRASGSRQPHQ